MTESDVGIHLGNFRGFLGVRVGVEECQFEFLGLSLFNFLNSGFFVSRVSEFYHFWAPVVLSNSRIFWFASLQILESSDLSTFRISEFSNSRISDSQSF